MGSLVRIRSGIVEPAYGWGDVMKQSVGVVTGFDADGDVLVDFVEHMGWVGVEEELLSLGLCFAFCRCGSWSVCFCVCVWWNTHTHTHTRMNKCTRAYLLTHTYTHLHTHTHTHG